MGVRSQEVLCVLAALVVVTRGQETVVSYTIPEETGEKFYVGNVARESRLYGNVSEDVFQQMKFQILTQGNEDAARFVIDESTSTIRTAVNLDREIICPKQVDCTLNFNVAVYLKDADTGVLDLYKIIRVRVIIEDLNDNKPDFFNKEVSLEIAENTNVNTGYPTDGAVDLDRGANNSIQRYVMEPANGMFGLEVIQKQDGSSDLNIVVKYPLDRETTSFYQLIIYAVDGGVPPKSGSVKINITITDENDNVPVFSEREYNKSVEENTPINSTIVHVTATDSDAGNNGLVRYRFSARPPNNVLETFEIDSETGVITSKAILNYEKTKKWSFDVEAYDSGSPSRTATVTVNINIININDNYPQININLPPGGTEISEAAHVGSFIAHVAVFDEDSDSQVITCQLLGDDFRLEDFKIANNYKVILNKELDHEVQDSYDVTIVCEDSGVPPNSNETSFVVKVQDVNDNYPVFKQKNYELTIPEEVYQSIMIQAEATDKDSGDNGKVTYGLQKGSDTRFSVNSRTGLITANTVFDREVDPEIRLHVLAWDSGNKSLTSTATVVVNITDINDNAPKFPSSPLTIRLLESEPMQSVNLNVTDPDFGNNGQFTLTFPQNDYLSEYFEFNSVTGEIKTLKPIDREEIPYFKFWVKAVDKGVPQMSSSAEVILQITDRNDNIPAIRYPNNANNTKVIPVSAPIGFIIATVRATDKDDGVNAQLLYFIDTGDTREIFKIDVNTGRITVGREMSGQDADTYKLEIAVRDNGEPQRTAMATLNVIVEPANSTSMASAAEETKQNMMLVAVIVGITVIISVAIIVSIFILRYMDKTNHARNPPPKNKEPNDNRFYDVAAVDESMSGSSNMSKDSDTELLKKRAKKEVSFSIDEDCSDPGNNSTLTNVTSFSTIKPSYLSMDYKSSEVDIHTLFHTTCVQLVEAQLVESLRICGTKII